MMLAAIIKAMMGLGLSLAIDKKASSGAAPVGGASADFSVAANSMYAPLLFGGMG